MSICRVCKAELQTVLSLGHHYLTGYLRPEEPDPAARSPLVLGRCQSCGLTQLCDQVPQETLYGGRYWYRSSLNGTMRRALADVAREMTARAALAPGAIICDVGCNDGTLIKAYTVPGLVTVGFEPAPNLAAEAEEACSIFIPDYFKVDERTEHLAGKAQAISAVAMFYDVPEPAAFCRDAAKLLQPGGVFLIQMNDLYALIHDGSFDIIGHEHLAYYTVDSLAPILKQAGLEIFAVERLDLNGGTVRYWIGFADDHPVEDSVGEQRLRDRVVDTPMEWKVLRGRIEGLTSLLRRTIEDEVKRGGRVYAYGASTRGNTILQAARLDWRLIKGIAEIHPEKIGLVTAGTRIPIVSEAEAREKAAMFLVLPYSYRKEFVDREQEFLKKGGKLLFPLPEVEVVGA